ncbi:hypothetical protein PHYSODRAFT_302193 [Phytophthora sojae]|uniref:Uncharacterized protein n=1 Tax=Phytophthora sojae (strain P6497) TaxID=1094619 RepID=G4ZP12_PHYSP|nr:hypothetical protein PHYSODRAFT_302193 [Phytophthora sojae]EGZ15767.1 hypothetical protein PHYSODRAFT_302193 [Phytophthora sojae]|eukprot:XP_009529516.1 hypothetical protein PHYSODRAFT_302193 [Phytophthora sojae]
MNNNSGVAQQAPQIYLPVSSINCDHSKGSISIRYLMKRKGNQNDCNRVSQGSRWARQHRSSGDTNEWSAARELNRGTCSSAVLPAPAPRRNAARRKADRFRSSNGGHKNSQRPRFKTVDLRCRTAVRRVKQKIIIGIAGNGLVLSRATLAWGAPTSLQGGRKSQRSPASHATKEAAKVHLLPLPTLYRHFRIAGHKRSQLAWASKRCRSSPAKSSDIMVHVPSDGKPLGWCQPLPCKPGLRTRIKPYRAVRLAADRGAANGNYTQRFRSDRGAALYAWQGGQGSDKLYPTQRINQRVAGAVSID